MDVSVEQSSELVMVYTVKVPAEEVSREVLTELKGVRRTHRQRGFRPGKVPMSIIRSKFGPAVRAQVSERLIRKTMNDVLQEADGLVYVSNPALKTKDIEKEGLAYAFEAEKLPKLEPANYIGVSVERPRVEVTDEDVEAKLEAIREENAFNEPVERDVVEAGDRVRLDYQVLSVNGEEPAEPMVRSGIEVELGTHSLLPGMDEALVGLAVGEEHTIEVGLPMADLESDDPEAEQQQQAQVTVTVHGLFKRFVPELDDELAKDDGRVETLEELRALMRSEIEEARNQEARTAAINSMIDALLQVNPFELPPGFLASRVDDEVRQRLQSILGPNQDLGPFASMLDGFREELRPSVLRSIKQSLLLEAIADK
ncbi:MAG: trigger factor, partial [Myxococcota bacterium]